MLLIYDIDDTLFESLTNFYRVYELITIKLYFKNSRNKRVYLNPDLELCKEKLPMKYIYKNAINDLSLKEIYSEIAKELTRINRETIETTKRRHRNPYLKEEYFLALEKGRDLLHLPLSNLELNVLTDIGFSDLLKPTNVYYELFLYLKRFDDIDMMIVSKGSAEIQCRKIERYPMKEIFTYKEIQILREKDLQNWKDLLHSYSNKYYKIYTIGNSLKDDVIPIKNLENQIFNVEPLWFKTIDFFTSKDDYLNHKDSVEIYDYNKLVFKILHTLENYKKIF